MTRLWSDFLTNADRPLIHKWKHYFPAYERHLTRFINTDVVFLEIGLGAGGSSPMWKRFLGPHARIVGIDVRSECKQFEDDQIDVRIGSQSDTAFLSAVIEEFGVPDVVLDDGSHYMRDVNATFDFLYPKMARNGLYMIEDLHTAYWPTAGGGLRSPDSFIERAKHMIDELNADHVGPDMPPTEFTRSTLSMHFYDSLVILEKGRHTAKNALAMGRPTETYSP